MQREILNLWQGDPIGLAVIISLEGNSVEWRRYNDEIVASRALFKDGGDPVTVRHAHPRACEQRPKRNNCNRQCQTETKGSDRQLASNCGPSGIDTQRCDA